MLAMDTKVLILDEPTIAQDWNGRKILQQIIRNLRKQGKMVLSILHDMDFVAENFERGLSWPMESAGDGTKEMILHRAKCLRKRGSTSLI